MAEAWRSGCAKDAARRRWKCNRLSTRAAAHHAGGMARAGGGYAARVAGGRSPGRPRRSLLGAARYFGGLFSRFFGLLVAAHRAIRLLADHQSFHLRSHTARGTHRRICRAHLHLPVFLRAHHRRGRGAPAHDFGAGRCRSRAGTPGGVPPGPGAAGAPAAFLIALRHAQKRRVTTIELISSGLARIVSWRSSRERASECSTNRRAAALRDDLRTMDSISASVRLSCTPSVQSRNPSTTE